MKQLSNLKSQVDELKLVKADPSTSEHVSELREKLEVEHEALQVKEKEVREINYVFCVYSICRSCGVCVAYRYKKPSYHT